MKSQPCLVFVMGSSGKASPLCDLGFSICKAAVVPLLSDEAGIRGHIKFLALGPPPTHLQAARGPTPDPRAQFSLSAEWGQCPQSPRGGVTRSLEPQEDPESSLWSPRPWPLTPWGTRDACSWVQKQAFS